MFRQQPTFSKILMSCYENLVKYASSESKNTGQCLRIKTFKLSAQFFVAIDESDFTISITSIPQCYEFVIVFHCFDTKTTLFFRAKSLTRF